jgi:hypothetical protein
MTPFRLGLALVATAASHAVDTLADFQGVSHFLHVAFLTWLCSS